MAEIPLLASDVARQLSAVGGVQAVVLGGSWARAAADSHSDIDLGIYYDPRVQLDIDGLRELAASLDDSGNANAVTRPGEWGQWINGGAWLTIHGQRLDWLYRNTPRVADYIQACVNGSPTAHYQAGHPHAFHTHIYLAEIALCISLEDAHGVIASLKRQVMPYPPRLKAALIRASLWEADFALQTSVKSATRDDAFHVAGSLFRSAACLVQVLFALNEAYFLNEKGSTSAVDHFGLRPDGFSAQVAGALHQPDLLTAHRAMTELVISVRSLCLANGFE